MPADALNDEVPSFYFNQNDAMNTCRLSIHFRKMRIYVNSFLMILKSFPSSCQCGKAT